VNYSPWYVCYEILSKSSGEKFDRMDRMVFAFPEERQKIIKS